VTGGGAGGGLRHLQPPRQPEQARRRPGDGEHGNRLGGLHP